MPPAPIDSVGLGALMVMALFVTVAVLMVVSFVCKVLLLIGWVPDRRTGRLRRIIVFLAGAAGETRVRRGDDKDRRSRPSIRGGGGSSGGAGASGDFS